MKRSTIEAAASAYIANDVSWTDEPPRETMINCRTDFKAGARWALLQVREYLHSDDKPIPAEKWSDARKVAAYITESVEEFCTIEDDK